MTIDFSKRLNLDGTAAKDAAAANSTGEDNEATAEASNRGGKKNRKKNKK